MGASQGLLQLAQDLEWLGCELEFCGHRHALEGFPGAGPTWDEFLSKQTGVLKTTAKIERELKNWVRFNPTELVGVNYPLEAALESIALLMKAVEEIKNSALYTVQELPGRVREFNRTIQDAFRAPQMLKE